MIYDFKDQTPKLDPNSWVAPNAVVIGNVELKKDSNVWIIREPRIAISATNASSGSL